MVITRKKYSRQSRKTNTSRKANRKIWKKKSIKQNRQNRQYGQYGQYGGKTLIDISISISISINYPSIGLDITNEIDLTDFHRAGKLVNAPIVNLKGAVDNQKYLVIMYDPDAPNGEGQNGNHHHVHWIFIQNSRNGNNGSNGSNGSNTGISGRQTILEYHQPSPPRGTHRYIFNVYNANGITVSDINSLVESGKTNTYNNTIMKKLTKIEHNPMMYTVTAGR